MKHERLCAGVTAAMLSGLVAVGAVGCLITGFGLPTESSHTVYALCMASAAVFSLLFSFRWGVSLAVCLTALTAGWLWHRGRFLEQLLSLLVRISKCYHNAYHWGYFPFGTGEYAADLPLAVLGGLIAMGLCFCLIRRREIILPLFLAALPLAACMVVTDTVPQTLFLFLWFLGFLLCVLPQSVRRKDTAQGCRLTWLVFLPVILALAGLFLAVPKDSYVNRSKELQAKLLSLAEELPELARQKTQQLSSGLSDDNRDSLNLKSLGPRPRYTHAVMEITADTGGPLYLRARDYDAYTGTGWTASPHRAETFGLAGNRTGSLTVSTRSKKDTLFLPYYPTDEALLVAGAAGNPEGTREYRVDYTLLPEGWQEILEAEAASGSTRIEFTELEIAHFGSTADRLRYTALPGQTKVAAQEMLRDILPQGASRWDAAEAIAEFVRNSAEYDLNTGRMPGDGADFALWFLEKGETGYCVHFATAAVVLLRAADIPARYVTGYLTHVQPGEKITVTAGDAHAWAEYYVPQLETWVALEATPTEEMIQEVPAVIPVPDPVETVPMATEGQPSETPLPSDSPDPPTLPQPPTPDAKTSFGWLLMPILMAAAVWVQRKLRLMLRAKAFASGNTNDRALARWREVVRLTKVLRETPPEDLHRLAQKAKYSQHRLTAEEIKQFDAFLGEKIAQLQQKPWYWRLAYRWVFVVY